MKVSGRSLPVDNRKFLATLGLCRRAGRLHYGYDMVVDGLAMTKLVLFAADLSQRTRNSVLQAATRKGVACRDIPFDMATLADAMGTKPVGIVGITEAGFAKLLDSQIHNKDRG